MVSLVSLKPLKTLQRLSGFFQELQTTSKDLRNPLNNTKMETQKIIDRALITTTQLVNLTISALIAKTLITAIMTLL